MFRKNIAFNKRLCEHIWDVPFQMRPSSPGFEPREGSSNLPKTFTFKIYIYLRNCSSIFCLFAVHLLLSWPYYLHLVLWLYFHLFVTSYTYVIFFCHFLWFLLIHYLFIICQSFWYITRFNDVTISWYIIFSNSLEFILTIILARSSCFAFIQRLTDHLYDTCINFKMLLHSIYRE